MKTVTVIVPTYNRPESLARCLMSIKQQTYQPTEVIIVNDGQTEVTGVGSKIVQTGGGRGSAAARNLGASVASSDLVAFIDDDCAADASWLLNLVSAMDDDKAGFAFGKTIYRAVGYWGHFPERLVHNSNGQWPGGANLIFKLSEFKKLGGFDSRFWGYRNEDTELAIRAVARGINYARARSAVVFHQASWWDRTTLLKSARNISVWVVLKKMYPKTYQEFGAPVAGVIVAPGDYWILVAMILIVPWLGLLIRYWWLGGRDLGLFWSKWPVWLILRRYWIWREGWRQRMVVI